MLPLFFVEHTYSSRANKLFNKFIIILLYMLCGVLWRFSGYFSLASGQIHSDSQQSHSIGNIFSAECFWRRKRRGSFSQIYPKKKRKKEGGKTLGEL